MYPRTSRVSKRRTGTRQCGTVWRNRYLPFATPHKSEATCFCFFNFCNFHPRNFHSALHPLTEPILFCSIPDRPFKVTAASPSFPPSKNSFLKVCYLPHTKTPNIPHQLDKDVILPSPKHLYCNIATFCRGPSLDFGCVYCASAPTPTSCPWYKRHAYPKFSFLSWELFGVLQAVQQHCWEGKEVTSPPGSVSTNAQRSHATSTVSGGFFKSTKS